MIELLKQLRDDYWKAGFREASRVGLIRDGHYHVPTDIDVICMYCGGPL